MSGRGRAGGHAVGVVIVALAGCATSDERADAQLRERVQLDVVACQEIVRAAGGDDARHAAFSRCMTEKGYRPVTP